MKNQAIVDFMIIGAQKSATTTLFDILKTHPELAACKKKEPEFFSHTKNWKEKVDTYHALYTKQKGQLAFEATTAYTAHPFHNANLREDLWAYNPKLKLIYIVRDPIDRIVSAHRFLYRMGYAKKKNINLNVKSSNYHILLSQYYYQIKPYIDRFGAENIKILLFEDFIKSPKNTVNTILEFLKVQPLENFVNIKSNTKSRKIMQKVGFSRITRWYLKAKKHLPYRVSEALKKRLMYRDIAESDLIFTNKTLQQLENELMPDIEKFEQLIDRDLSHWKLKFKQQ